MAALRSHTPKADPRLARRGAAAMRYATICSGIEAVSVALSGLDAEPVFFADIEPFPKALLAHHYPDVPELGDMTKWREWPDELLMQVDLIVAGTPCQAFSVAGARKSLDDDRGNLTLQFVRICNAIDHLRRDSGLPPVIIVYENVPGLLSVADNAFGCLLAALAGSDAPVPPPDERSWTDAGVVSGPSRAVAWRCLDAQFFGVAQRRKRVFAVASAGDGPHPAQILFESEGVRGDSAPSRDAGQRTAGGAGEGFETVGALTDGAHNGGGLNGQDAYSGRVLPCDRDGAPIAFNWQNGGGYGDANDGLAITEDCCPPQSRSQVAAVAFKASHYTRDKDGAPNAITPPLSADADKGGDFVCAPLPFDTTQITSPGNVSAPKPGDPCHPLAAGAHAPSIANSMAVRRLTPVECERLQGFPDNYTRIPYRGKPASQCPDGPRYRALGNSMAVPVMRWILQRVMA